MLRKMFAVLAAAPLMIGAPAFAESGQIIEEVKAPTEEVPVAQEVDTEELKDEVNLSGFYVDLNNIVGFVGGSYDANVLEPHIGFEGTVGEKFSYYIQGGPSIVSVDGGDTTTEISGYLGGAYSINERVEIYGEFYATSLDGEDDSFMSVETGVTYRF